MNLEIISLVALALAILPCALFLLNLVVYRPIAGTTRAAQSFDVPGQAHLTDVSVLIPARNEERNLPSTLQSVLQNQRCEFEVIVLDDHSTDGTASVVSKFAALDARVRLEKAPPLPLGWCGKQHACHVLAGLAKYPLLLFMDADVRLASNALRRLKSFMGQRDIALASGVPRQQLGTISEWLLLPLIHFVLLGFLPMHAMRRTRWASMSAGCGQLFIVQRQAYDSCGGHAMLRDSLHDGIQLPRVFRRAGFATDLFDATDLATCRMYQTNCQTWSGLAKNATEGLAAPTIIVPTTLLLLGGQVLPFALLCDRTSLPPDVRFGAVLASLLALLPRIVAAWRFGQPLGSALAHPIGVLALLAIQWQALLRHLLGKPAVWKGRAYRTPKALSHQQAI